MKKKIIIVCVILASIPLAFPIQGLISRNQNGNLNDLALETVISRRTSIKRSEFYSDVEVPSEAVLKVLWASCGYSSRGGRTVQSLCVNYPLIVYACNTTACS